jgi:hypothetical protein
MPQRFSHETRSYAKFATDAISGRMIFRKRGNELANGESENAICGRTFPHPNLCLNFLKMMISLVH